MSNTIVTGEVRFSYVNVFTPRQPQNGQGEAKYQITILLPKTDIATKQAIDVAIQQTLQEGIPTFGGQMPARPAIPIHDGDGVRPNGEPFGEECKGCWVFTASSKQKPEVVDANVQPIISQSEVYSGCYGRVSIRFFAYNRAGKKGIGCGLGNVQKLRDGDPLGGGTTAAQDFGGQVANTQPVQTSYQQPSVQAPQPQQPQQPAQAQYNQPSIDSATGQPYNFLGI